MRAYELTLVLRPTLKEDERKKLLTSVKGFFDGATFIGENEWGEKPLSYPIKKEISGFYINLKLETKGEVPSDFEQRLFTNDNVLRHLFLRGKDKPKKSRNEGVKIGTKTKVKAPASKIKKVEKKVVSKKATVKTKTQKKKAVVKKSKKK